VVVFLDVISITVGRMWSYLNMSLDVLSTRKSFLILGIFAACVAAVLVTVEFRKSVGTQKASNDELVTNSSSLRSMSDTSISNGISEPFRAKEDIDRVSGSPGDVEKEAAYSEGYDLAEYFLDDLILGRQIDHQQLAKSLTRVDVEAFFSRIDEFLATPESIEYRVAILKTMTMIPSPRTAVSLAKLIQNPPTLTEAEFKVVTMVFDTLSTAEDERGRDEISRILENLWMTEQNSVLSQTLTDSMLKLGSSRALEMLIEHVEIADPEANGEAYLRYSLSQISNQGAIPQLSSYLSSGPSMEVKFLSLNALLDLGSPNATNHILSWASSLEGESEESVYLRTTLLNSVEAKDDIAILFKDRLVPSEFRSLELAYDLEEILSEVGLQ
jgi:hypothetical protein